MGGPFKRTYPCPEECPLSIADVHFISVNSDHLSSFGQIFHIWNEYGCSRMFLEKASGLVLDNNYCWLTPVWLSHQAQCLASPIQDQIWQKGEKKTITKNFQREMVLRWFCFPFMFLNACICTLLKGKGIISKGDLERAEKEGATSVSLKPKGTWWARRKDNPVEGNGQKQRDCQSLTGGALEPLLLHLLGLCFLC